MGAPVFVAGGMNKNVTVPIPKLFPVMVGGAEGGVATIRVTKLPRASYW